MIKTIVLRTTLGLLALLCITALIAWFAGGHRLYDIAQATSPSTTDRDYALQDDSKVDVPPLQETSRPAPTPLKNVYWGELHIHTVESLDAVLFGTTLTIEDAYRFAKGEPLRSDGGELMQLSRPLDFLAITDHAEGFGLRTRCDNDDLSVSERLNCYFMETPNIAVFLGLISVAGMAEASPGTSENAGEYFPEKREKTNYTDWPICEEDPDRCYQDSINDWTRYQQLADKYNEPGVLTTFAGYEFSPLVTNGKHHRNVIFNGSDLPEHAVSSIDVANAVDLWRALENDCTGDCDFLTIPHNMNKAWGLFYSPWTWDGQPYDEESWRLRERREPIAEMYQVKGSSECAFGVGSTDEECNFGQVLEPCETGEAFGGVATTFALSNCKEIPIQKYLLLTTPDLFLQRIDEVVEMTGISQGVKRRLIKRLEEETQVDVHTIGVSTVVESLNVKKAMIIHDKNDRVVPISRSKNVSDNWSVCKLLEIEGTGHFRILRTDWVIDRAMAFLDG